MSAHTKKRPTNHASAYKVVIEMPGKEKRFSFVPAKHLEKLEAFLEKYGETDAIEWTTMASARLAKHGKMGLILRGARYRENLSQKELAKRSGVSQENISKMENGQRPIGKKVASKLAKALRLSTSLLYPQ